MSDFQEGISQGADQAIMIVMQEILKVLKELKKDLNELRQDLKESHNLNRKLANDLKIEQIRADSKANDQNKQTPERPEQQHGSQSRTREATNQRQPGRDEKPSIINRLDPNGELKATADRHNAEIKRNREQKQKEIGQPTQKPKPKDLER